MSATARARRRSAAALMVLAAVVGAVAWTASASAGAKPSLALSPTSGAIGTGISVTGYNFGASASGTVLLRDATVASFRTDRKGDFSVSFSIPGNAAPGPTTISATASTASATAAFTVLAPTTAVSSGPPASTVLFGVSTPSGPYNLAELDAFERDAGKRVGLLMFFQGWAHDQFDATAIASIAARGAIPEITWEPWDYLAGIDQPAYSLATIIGGSHDAYITGWAQAAKAYGGPLLVRFAHEMNDRHYPWSELTNGNQPGQYVAAWRHVVDIFRAVGATNVKWVWSPNVSYDGTLPLAQLYPGDSYVDWVAVDGYNGGSALPWGGWLSFNQIFGSTLAELAAVAPSRPIMIGETASVEPGGSKAAWISDFFAQLAQRPNIQAFVWFNHNKEADWRIESSSAAATAFAQSVADPRYH